MQNRRRILAGAAALSLVLAGCAKKDAAATDSAAMAAPAAATDHTADAAAIVAADSAWLRGFHAVVPGAVAAFRPQIVVSQCGVDTHREDPLAELELTVDGQRAAFLAMRELADTYAEGRWLAVGGGGYG